MNKKQKTKYEIIEEKWRLTATLAFREEQTIKLCQDIGIKKEETLRLMIKLGFIREESRKLTLPKVKKREK